MNDRTHAASAFSEETTPEPVTVEWTAVVAAPDTGCRARPAVRRVNVLAAPEWGAVGGAVIAAVWAFLAGFAFWLPVVIAALAGAALWATLAVIVSAQSGSRSAGAALAGGVLQFVRGAIVLVYVAAVLVIVGYVIHLKMKIHSPPQTPTVVIPHATVR